jgi:hypothetical protein
MKKKIDSLLYPCIGYSYEIPDEIEKKDLVCVCGLIQNKENENILKHRYAAQFHKRINYVVILNLPIFKV